MSEHAFEFLANEPSGMTRIMEADFRGLRQPTFAEVLAAAIYLLIVRAALTGKETR